MKIPALSSVACARAIAIALASSILSACAFSVERPTTPAGTLTENGPSYSEALDYLERSRQQIELKLRDLDGLNTATKAGVGMGLAGAAAASAFQTTARPILGFLTFGAVSYVTNISVDPPSLQAVLNAGLDNLECIESAGSKLNTEFAVKRGGLANLLAKLYIDIDAAQRYTAANQGKPGFVPFSTTILHARESYAVGALALSNIDLYLAKNPVSGEMVRATRSTIEQVNQELRNRSPSVSTIAQTGSILGAFLNMGTGIQASVTASADKIRAGFTAHAEPTPLEQALIDDQEQLKTMLADIGNLSTSSRLTTVSQCRAQFIAAVPLALTFAVPVEMNAGETRNLSVLSGASVVPRWSGQIPTDLTWNVQIDNGGALSVIARPDAKTNSYKLRLADFSGHISEEFTLNVHAAPTEKSEGKPVVKGPDAPKPGNNANPNPPVNPTGPNPPPPPR